jgi:large-conductance mechanosensitive channel
MNTGPNNQKSTSSSTNMQTIKGQNKQNQQHSKTSFLELKTKLRKFSGNVSQVNIILGILSFFVFGILIFLCVYVINSHNKYKKGQQNFTDALELTQNTIQSLQNRQQQLYNTFMITPQPENNS